MARVKPKRHGVVTDMTAMTDVAFLLLTFFILTAQFKKPDAEAITTPSSISTTTLDDTNLMTISITPDGRYFFTPIDNNSEKSQVLDKWQGSTELDSLLLRKMHFLNCQW